MCSELAIVAENRLESKNFDSLNNFYLTIEFRKYYTLSKSFGLLWEKRLYFYYVKSVRIRTFIQSKCGKIRTRKTQNTDTFRALFNFGFSFPQDTGHKLRKDIFWKGQLPNALNTFILHIFSFYMIGTSVVKELRESETIIRVYTLGH